MNNDVTNTEKIRRLPFSIASGAANGLAAQWTFFGPPFVLLLSDLGTSNAQVGFLFSLFPFAGLLALVLGPAAARFGYKRTYLTFWGARYIFALGLLLLPWLRTRVGAPALGTYVAALVLGFAICRAIGETGYYPWSQEFVPPSMRGKYYAAYYGFGTVASFAAVLVASYVVGRGTGLGRYLVLILAGVAAGVATVWFAAYVPGGTPQTGRVGEARWQGLAGALADRRLRGYLVAASLVVLGSAPLASFQPLLLKDRIGLSSGPVVLVQGGVLLGGFGAGFLWGWIADRYGSKPVIMSTVLLNAAAPLGWALVPRGVVWTMPAALLVAAVVGAASNGWLIGSSRLLYGHIIPPERRTAYTSLHYAWMGVVGGVGPLLAGALLDGGRLLHGQVWFLPVDAYLVFLVMSAGLSCWALWLFKRVEGDSEVSFTHFVRMFTRGNPLLALESSIRYGRAEGETAGASLAQRLGQAHSPLTIDELLEALSDPRYAVRMEAIISLARAGSDTRATAALLRTLAEDHEGELRVMAAWALGRVGDRSAAEGLAAALAGTDARVRCQCARSLGYLGDTEAIPLLMGRLRAAGDIEERLACAAALGNLHAAVAVPELLALLASAESEPLRVELALAVARVVSGELGESGERGEGYFVRLWRSTRSEPGTGLAQAMLALGRRLHGLPAEQTKLLGLVSAGADACAAGDLPTGAAYLAEALAAIPAHGLNGAGAAVLRDCSARLAVFGADRPEYFLLALHTLDAGITAMSARLAAGQFAPA